MGRIQEPPKMSKDYDNATVKGCSELFVAFALSLLVCFVITCCVGCRPHKEVVTEYVEHPVVVTQEHHTENVRVDIVRDTIRQRDSVIYRDSVYHYIKGDTTIIERWHYVTNNHHYTDNNNKVRVDTLIKVDSVQVPVEVVRVKEVAKVEEVNRLKWWQKLFIGIGGIALVVFGFGIAYKIGKKKS